jgi:hypothetical protein
MTKARTRNGTGAKTSQPSSQAATKRPPRGNRVEHERGRPDERRADECAGEGRREDEPPLARHVREQDRDRGGRDAERETGPEPVSVELDRLRDELPDRPLGGRERSRTRLGHRRGGYRRPVSWDVVHHADLEWEERPGHEGQEPRQRPRSPSPRA